MLIAKISIDNKSRLTLPKYFMEANNLNTNTHVLLKATDREDEVIIKFVNKDTRKTSTTTEA